MFKDDDEEEENTFGVTRYPCMPSLVALQQMRNRLHLAFLGRKLMKWTALATGRELRRLAQELYEVYDGFGEDLRNAFILLARSRYFYPTLNSVVTEDIGKKAGVVVQQCGRTVSGVKIVQFEIYETEYPPYPHLGIEKGGQTILETKKAWLELLRRLIMMMQLRAGFLMVELANRNANKKMNVLAKIVIPKTNVTMGYINNELEELAREEFFRLKKVLEIKRRMYGDKTGSKKTDQKTTAAEADADADADITCPVCIEEAEALARDEVKEQEIVEPPKEVVKLSLQELTKDTQLLQDKYVIELIKQISEIVDVTKDMDKKGLVTASIDDFIKTAEELKAKLGSTPEPAMKTEPVQELDTKPEEDIYLNKLCDACKEKYNRKSKEAVIPEDEKKLETQEVDESPHIDTKPEDDINLNKICEACKEKCKGKNKEAVMFEDEKIEELPKEIESKETIKSKQSSNQDTYVIESDAELGTFETEVKEITKIIKTKNEDGSISIQKKVIKIEREVKAPIRLRGSQNPSQSTSANASGNVSYQPSSTSSGKSNPYPGSRTIGVVTVSSSDLKDNLSVPNIVTKKAKSEILSPFSPMSDPVERFCMSSVTLLSTDLDFDYAVYNDTTSKANPDWLCLKASNPMIEEIISNYEPGFCNISPTTNTENCTNKSSSIDINLYNYNKLSSEDKPHKEIGNNFSFSDSTCTKKCNKKLGLSVSFNIKSPSSSATLNESNKNDKNK